jgi:hypothetical protein
MPINQNSSIFLLNHKTYHRYHGIATYSEFTFLNNVILLTMGEIEIDALTTNNVNNFLYARPKKMQPTPQIRLVIMEVMSA